MTDGGLKVELDSALAERVRIFASAAGAKVESVVRDAVADYVDDWSMTLERLAEYDRTGETTDAEEALGRFQVAVASRAKNKA
jgi:predicted transcriptional regulator